MLIALVLISLMAGSGLLGWWLTTRQNSQKVGLPIQIIKPRPLDKYTIENLTKAEVRAGKFETKEITSDEGGYISYLFEFTFDPTFQELSSKNMKTTTGQINLPLDKQTSTTEKFPIVLMLRGYVDQELYKTGDGTRSVAKFFAENGFITVAPDFLGYAESDPEAENIFETRFQTHTTILSLIESLDQIDRWDEENIFIWAHSNGGQVALTVLEITGKSIPTTLWAPVSKPFPYSILYYTDGSEDGGKLIRRELAKFEDMYDTNLYSLTQYFDKINAPIQIHQGTADGAVPVDWSNNLSQILLNLDLDLDYFKYPGANHNLRPSWNEAISRDLEFFNSHLH